MREAQRWWSCERFTWTLSASVPSPEKWLNQPLPQTTVWENQVKEYVWLHAAGLAHLISTAVGLSLHCFANRAWCTVKAQPIFDHR